MLYFAWVRPNEIFDQRVHLRHDEDIFHLSLTHKEGCPAVLDLKVSNPYKNNSQRDRAWGMLSYQKSETEAAVCLFRGRVLAQSCTQGDHFFVFSLIAQNHSFQEEWTTLAPSLKKEPFYTPLCDDGKPETVIASQPLCFYWDRCQGNLSLSHAFKGGKEWDLTPDCDPKTMTYEQKEPLHKVSFSLSAQWIQTLTGYKEIAREIENLFPGKKISTYTPKALIQNWPHSGASVRRSGYYIVHSSLEEREKIPFQAPSRRYASNFSIEGRLATYPKKTRLLAHRSWFDASLLVAYHYKQKRKENLEFDLCASLPLSTPSTKTEHIKLPLQKIVLYEDLPHLRLMAFYTQGTIVQYRGKVYQALCDHGLGFHFQPEHWKELPEKSNNLFLSLQSSFFLTAQGRKVFEYALERAKTALTWGTRCAFVHVRGPLCQWASLTLNDTALLTDARLPGGRLQGKIIKYTLTADGKSGQAQVELTLAGRIMQGMPPPSLPEPEPLYAIGYTQHPTNGRPPYQLYKNMYTTVRGVTFQEFYDQKKEDPLEFLIHSQLSNIVRHIRIQNGPKDQEDLLKNFQDQTISTEDLKGKETKISIDFLPIHSTDQVTHTLKPKILSSWADPA